MNIGGRPLNAWPAFIPATFELIILFAVLGGLVALFVTLHLPTVYHPVFNHPDFRRASRDGFFSLHRIYGPALFDPRESAFFLRTLGSALRANSREMNAAFRHPNVRWASGPRGVGVPVAGGLRQPEKRHEDQAADGE